MKHLPLNFKAKEHKSRLSLTLLFAGCVFVIILAVLIFVALVALVMVNVGVFSKDEIGFVNGNNLIALMILISFLVGIIFAFFFGKLFMKPINIIINTMNRLASGDFKARVYFDSVFAKHPTVSELTESINTMAEELENTEMLRTDFINNFSHEFKTPIVSIAGFAKLLKQDDISKEQKNEYIKIIEEESLRLSNMATNVLNLTKIENQNILSNVTTYNLSEQIRTCFLLLENKWTDKDFDFILNFDEYNITASEELLRQVWVNLIDNAIKYTPFGGTIEVKINQNQSFTEIIISNTGSNIEKEDYEKIFRKFYQADTSHSASGNGVGLAIVKKIIDLHNGNIGVISENNITSFTVVLPNTQAINQNKSTEKIK